METIPDYWITCPHCGARHDGSLSATWVHPDMPHKRPTGTSYSNSMPNGQWHWSVSIQTDHECQYTNHGGYAFDQECAERAIKTELRRLGL